MAAWSLALSAIQTNRSSNELHRSCRLRVKSSGTGGDPLEVSCASDSGRYPRHVSLPPLLECVIEQGLNPAGWRGTMRQAPEGWDGLAQLAARQSVCSRGRIAHHLRCAPRLHHLTLAGAGRRIGRASGPATARFVEERAGAVSHPHAGSRLNRVGRLDQRLLARTNVVSWRKPDMANVVLCCSAAGDSVAVGGARAADRAHAAHRCGGGLC
jgi:hypothetical protein